MSLAVMSSTTGLRELTSLTDQTIVKGLENVPGVARIDVNGKVTRQILVQIKPNALNALGIGVDQVMNAIRNANQDVPAGRISRGQSDTIVRIEGKIKDPAQFGRIIVAQQGAGPVYLSQVADVIDGEKEETSLARINGERSITIDVLKAQDANIVETGRGIIAAVDTLKQRLPKDVSLSVDVQLRRLGREERQPREEHDPRGRGPHGADRVPVPAQLAQHDHHRPHAAAVRDRDVHRALCVRLLAQLPDADGAVAVHRPPDRRRDRRAREHRAPPRRWARTTRPRRGRAPTRSASR